MENNYRIEYAQNELNKAQAIEDYVRRGIAKDLYGVITDLNYIDENGNEMTPTSVCIDSLTFYTELLKDVIVKVFHFLLSLRGKPLDD